VIACAPDEFAHALIDDKTRLLWDLNATSASKGRGDQLKVSYSQGSEQLIKFTFADTFLNGSTTYLIHEQCEGESRYYEL
jgi:hypothetical protein